MEHCPRRCPHSAGVMSATCAVYLHAQIAHYPRPWASDECSSPSVHRCLFITIFVKHSVQSWLQADMANPIDTHCAPLPKKQYKLIDIVEMIRQESELVPQYRSSVTLWLAGLFVWMQSSRTNLHWFFHELFFWRFEKRNCLQGKWNDAITRSTWVSMLRWRLHRSKCVLANTLPIISWPIPVRNVCTEMICLISIWVRLVTWPWALSPFGCWSKQKWALVQAILNNWFVNLGWLAMNPVPLFVRAPVECNSTGSSGGLHWSWWQSDWP